MQIIISQALQSAKEKLCLITEVPALEADLLLCFTLGYESREELLLDAETPLNQLQQTKFTQILNRRIKGEPIAYILGYKEFWEDRFLVNRDVLIPRPETELIVEIVLEIYKKRDLPINMLELGVGSGCLLLTLLKIYANAKGCGIDISQEAVEVAMQNAAKLNVRSRVRIIKSNWFDNLPNGALYDLIISNPPYIREKEWNALCRSVRDFEPQIALTGGESGLAHYMKIADSVHHFLRQGGNLILEIGMGQCAQVIEIFNHTGLEVIQIYKDLQKIERVVLLKKQ